MRTIILDSEEDILELLTYTLSQAEFQIQGFHDYEELLVQKPIPPPQLIIVGNTHPSDTQMDICKRIRKIPEYADTVLICLTTSQVQCDAHSSNCAEIDGCVLTPILPKDLVKKIKEVLNQKLSL
ncbi:MAG: hypothetical protein AAFP83_05955, partial [Bacteroidota bacterium]